MKKKNSFVYQINYCPNPDCIQIQARVLFPKGDDLDSSLGFEYVTSDPIRAQRRHPLFNQLASIEGLKSASGGDYNLQILKANSLFTWEELLPQILKAIQDHLAKGMDMVASGEPMRPSRNYLKFLRAQGCDV